MDKDAQEREKRRQLTDALFPWPFHQSAGFVDWALRDDPHIDQNAQWVMPRWAARQLLQRVALLLEPHE